MNDLIILCPSCESQSIELDISRKTGKATKTCQEEDCNYFERELIRYGEGIVYGKSSDK